MVHLLVKCHQNSADRSKEGLLMLHECIKHNMQGGQWDNNHLDIREYYSIQKVIFDIVKCYKSLMLDSNLH